MNPTTDTTTPIVERPDSGSERPVVVSIPHSGVFVPDEDRPLYAVDPDELSHAGDLYVDQLYRDAALLGATVVRTPISRFVVDLNRAPDDLSPLSVAGGRVRREVGYYGHRGVFWAVTADGSAVYREPLPADVVQRRLARYYHPYHEALRQELARTVRRHGFAILLDAHSMPSQARDGRGVGGARADIVPGNLLGESCGRALTDAVVRFWRLHDRSVTVNRPYRGGAITRTHAAPSAGVHAIQIEINRALYMCETTLRFAPGFDDVRRQCSLFVAQLGELDLRAPARRG